MKDKAPKSPKSPGMQRSPELMNAGDTILCVVDLQERLVPAIDQHERIIWNAGRLLDGANVLGVEVVATEQYPEKLGPTVKSIASRLEISPESKITFSSANIFRGFADVSEHAESVKRHRVLLCGIEAHVCLQQTAYDLLAAGYSVYLAVDATGSRFASDLEIALRRMESAGVILTTTESALFEWCERAGTPEFKQISALVKQSSP